jgi:nucleotide-binding universal stress UspA family protein
MAKRKLIIHPTDFSRSAGVAFTTAMETAKRDDAELILLYVLEPLSGLSEETYVARRIPVLEAAEAAARKAFAGLRARAKKAGVPTTEVVIQGWPPEQIARLAKARGADLIVMGTRGRTGLKKLLLGSVAERVVAIAPCPVLTVRVK